jgi:flavin reductase (DIM6/NTAB) family NADH-FMN oxidoreductase RutF
MASLIHPKELSARQRYRLMISLVVPRPIGWISTRSMDGLRNLAPFSFFNAFSATPMLVGASIGRRGDTTKDTLTNIRQTGVFAVNLVAGRHLEAMVRTSGDWPPDVDEFRQAGLEAAQGERVDVPYVADAAAAFECRLFREVDLGASPNALVIGEVVGIHLAGDLRLDPESYHVDAASLDPVGRLGGAEYGLLGEVRTVPRPSGEASEGG